MIYIRHIRLRSITATRTFGVDVPFRGGLNVIWADNTQGKSTLLQSVLYGLGMERSLGASLHVPLPYAMREEIRETPNGEVENVIQSYVALTIENHRGNTMSLRRDIKGGADPRLVQTWSGGIDAAGLDDGRSDYFLHDRGSASTESGFHKILADFLGWDLPDVPRFDGGESPLYLETLFPMFFVEQKRGWAATQGPLPTIFRIQDLQRRVMEFILNLDAGKTRIRLAELRKEKASLELVWRERRREIFQGAGALVRVTGLPLTPTAEFAGGLEANISIYFQDEWMTLDQAEDIVSERIQEFDDSQLQKIESIDDELRNKLDTCEARHRELVAQLEILRREYQFSLSEKQALDERMGALELDLRQNQDTAKLQRFGSLLGGVVDSGTCPTCHQNVSQELLPEVAAKTMGIEENIAFIKSQLDLYRSLRSYNEADLNDLNIKYNAAREEINNVRAQIRSLKNDLLRPGKMIARAELEEIIRTEAMLESWKNRQEIIDASLDELREVASEWVRVNEKIKSIGRTDLSIGDRNKIAFIQNYMQELLKEFHFTSFQPNEITVSDEVFRPQVLRRADDGELVERDIGFEVSASDGIRLKWAYYLAILFASERFELNHVGFVVFDEPGQQQMRDVDLSALLRWAARNVGPERQVILSTSEDRERVKEALASSGATLQEFDGYLLHPL